MANRDTPFGARPVGHLSGGFVRNNEFPVASGYATSIYSGDFVKLAADGTVQRAAAGDELLGVFAGVRYTQSDGKPIFEKKWTASTVAADAKALVYDDPGIIYEMQHDSVGGNVAAADVGLMYDIVATAGSDVYKVSREQIDTSTGVTTTAQLRQIAIVDRADNEIGASAKALVVINEHLYRGTDGI